MAELNVEDVHAHPTAEARRRLERFKPGTFVRNIKSTELAPYDCGWIIGVRGIDVTHVIIEVPRRTYTEYVDTTTERVAAKDFDTQYVILESNPFESILLKSKNLEG